MDAPPASARERSVDPLSPVTSQSIARSAGSAGAATLTSRLLGLVRETVLAAYFGAGNQMDAFNVAFRIPNLVRDLFAERAMSAAFVPTFTRHLALHGRDPQAARRASRQQEAFAALAAFASSPSRPSRLRVEASPRLTTRVFGSLSCLSR